jgi:thiamine-phosphate pyrophosphorylase
MRNRLGFQASHQGIAVETCAPLVRAGADCLAVLGAVWHHPDGPAAGVKAMNEGIKEVLTHKT